MSTQTPVGAQEDRTEQVRSLLRPFLEAHPDVTLDWRVVRKETNETLCLTRPRGDEGLILSLPENLDSFAETLNNLLLPNRYTALWHRDTKNFEIIWTSYPLRGGSIVMKEREFDFSLKSTNYKCRFHRSSDRLLSLARNARFVAMSHSGHRNLLSFQRYVQQSGDNGDKSVEALPIGEPYSFWISDVEWDEDEVLKLVRHLNFYLTYYDALSPIIYIHSPPEEKLKPASRYRLDDFPTRIDAHEIEDDLLQLWMAAKEGDAARRFIYYYRIVEYASHAYIDREARRSIWRLLEQPHARSDVGNLVDQVVLAALEKSMEDSQKMINLLQDIARVEVLWEELERNRSSFEEDVEFDGGFRLTPIILRSTTLDTFKGSGMSQFISYARRIRNRLSHGRDRSTQAAITPTTENFRRLEPWSSAMSILAGEVLMFRSLQKVY